MSARVYQAGPGEGSAGGGSGGGYGGRAPVTPASSRVRRAAAEDASDDLLSAKSLSRIQARTRFPDLGEYYMRAQRCGQTPPKEDRALGDAKAEFVAPWLGRVIVRAYADLDECPELDAVWKWLSALKTAYQFPSRAADVDMENGMALLEAMAVICHESDVQVPEPETELDEEGHVVRRNIKRLRDALHAFPWAEHHTGAPLRAINFKRVQRKSLCGFVVLAAALSQHKDRLLCLMEALSDYHKEALEGLIHNAMCAMGMTLNTGPGDDESLVTSALPLVPRSVSSDGAQSSVTATTQGSRDSGSVGEVEDDGRGRRRHGDAQSDGGRTGTSYEAEIGSLRRELEAMKARCMQGEERALALETIASELTQELDALRGSAASGRTPRVLVVPRDRRYVTALRKRCEDSEARCAALERALAKERGSSVTAVRKLFAD